jgi:chromosome segregation protein
MRAEKSAAEKRALKGETEAARERAASAATAAAAAAQLEAAVDERAALTAAAEALSALNARQATELATAAGHLRLLDDQLPDMANRLERGAGALARCETQLGLTQARSGELERLLVAKGSEAEALRGSAVAAEGRQRAALTAVRGLEKELAEANARIGTLRSAEAEAARACAALQGELEALSQTAAVQCSEVSALKDELGRRPPIDIIKELDVENLMQRNMQAAAAMHQLLAWQQQHSSQPLASAMKAPQ